MIKKAQNIKRRFIEFRRDASGLASIEMAFIFPVMLIVYFGLVDVTNLLSANRRVTLAASTLADLVTQAPGTVTQADLDGFFEAASPIMEPFPADAISLELFGFTKNGANVEKDWEHKNDSANCGGSPSPDDAMKALMAEGNDVVVSRVCYTWTPISGYVIGSDPITVSEMLTLRPRQSTKLSCTDC